MPLACLVVLLLSGLTACAHSVPWTTAAGERLPAAFQPAPDAAQLMCVIPFALFGQGVPYTVVVDGQPIGLLAPQTAAIVVLTPGVHAVQANIGSLQATVPVQLAPGQQLVLSVQRIYGDFSSRLELTVLDEQRGRALVEAATVVQRVVLR